MAPEFRGRNAVPQAPPAELLHRPPGPRRPLPPSPPRSQSPGVATSPRGAAGLGDILGSPARTPRGTARTFWGGHGHRRGSAAASPPRPSPPPLQGPRKAGGRLTFLAGVARVISIVARDPQDPVLDGGHAVGCRFPIHRGREPRAGRPGGTPSRGEPSRAGSGRRQQQQEDGAGTAAAASGAAGALALTPPPGAGRAPLGSATQRRRQQRPAPSPASPPPPARPAPAGKRRCGGGSGGRRRGGH